MSMGGITGGLARMVPLFQAIYDAALAHLCKQKHWHADETRWPVFIEIPEKVGHRWMLWLIQSKEAAVFVLDPTRAHDVPEKALGPDARGIMSVDRYSGYKAMIQVKEGKIILSFCWSHARRDFLDVGKSWPKEEPWAFEWLGRIGLLYKVNDERVAALKDPEVFAVKDKEVRQQVEELVKQRDKELQDKDIHPARKKVLSSQAEHWSGLTVFVDHPEVPMDNNTGERALRGPVVGRKNYRGSGARWAGELAAMMFSVFGTLALWKINPRLWLTDYLQTCARAGGKPPDDLTEFLPWTMSEQRKKELALVVSQKR